MKLPVRILLALLCAAMVLALPFVVPSPTLLTEPMEMIMENMSEDDLGFFSFLIPSARADETAEEPDYTLPINLKGGVAPMPDPANYTAEGYEDDSIQVRMETREEDGVIWRLAWVKIASPTQLRTGIGKVGAKAKTIAKPTPAKTGTLAERYNAVLAMNGDMYTEIPTKKTYEIRMGTEVRTGTNRKRDTLIIDENGDFHIVFPAEPEDQLARFKEIQAEHTIVNAFTFGPALVCEGQELTLDKDYAYNPKSKEPRSAIGQIDTLSYVLVIAEGRGKSAGVTQATLAEFMASIGCRVAYNLDGGGTATMVFPQVVNGKLDYTSKAALYNKIGGSERPQSDIIYFATAVGAETEK